MKVSEPTGRSANSLAISLARVESGVWSRTLDRPPIATPITARSTTGDSFRRTASGWLKATTTSKVANTARTRTMSSMAPRSVAASAPQGAPDYAEIGRASHQNREAGYGFGEADRSRL